MFHLAFLYFFRHAACFCFCFLVFSLPLFFTCSLPHPPPPLSLSLSCCRFPSCPVRCSVFLLFFAVVCFRGTCCLLVCLLLIDDDLLRSCTFIWQVGRGGPLCVCACACVCVRGEGACLARFHSCALLVHGCPASTPPLLLETVSLAYATPSTLFLNPQPPVCSFDWMRVRAVSCVFIPQSQMMLEQFREG